MKILLLLLGLCLIPGAVRAQAEDKVATATGIDSSFAQEIDLTKNYFEHETMAGVIFTTGNTNSVNASGNSWTLWRIRRFQNTWNLGMYFNRIFQTTSTGVSEGTIANYIFGIYRLDYYFTQNTTFLFGVGGYTDEIKGIDLAGQAFIGINHYFLRAPNYYLSLAGGYNYTYEDLAPPDPNRNLHSLFVQFDYQQQLNKVVTFGQKALFLESLNHTEDFRINSDTLFKLKMTDLLSLVVGFHLRFDNAPPTGFKKLDTISDLSLAISLKRPKPVPECPEGCQ
jgi:putative salt-induced outer membrane protein YdiY